LRFAIPLFGDHVAPRFCSAEELLVVDMLDGAEASRKLFPLYENGLPERLALVSRMGVERLYCGGFNGRFMQMAEGLGVQVRWGLVGLAEEAVSAVLSGREPNAVARGCGGGGGGRRRGLGGPGRRGGRFS